MLDRQPLPEEISSDYREIAELIGMDGFLRLVEQYGGYQLYIPKYEGLCRNARDEEIRASFTGYNIEELARKYNLTSRYIRYLVAPILREVRARPPKGQITIWEAAGQSAPGTLPQEEPFDIMERDEGAALPGDAESEESC